MENWVVLGLLAAVAYALSVVMNKLTISQAYFALDGRAAALLIGLGIFLTLALYFLLQGGAAMPSDPKTAAVALGAGVFWALGTICVLIAFSGGADVAKLTPVFNTNTLFAVAIGILLLNELPDPSNAIKVALGAALIFVGGILVST